MIDSVIEYSKQGPDEVKKYASKLLACLVFNQSKESKRKVLIERIVPQLIPYTPLYAV
jgi:hypothetical protein